MRQVSKQTRNGNKRSNLIKLVKSQLKSQTDSQLGVLDHMVEAEILNLVVGGMDMIVRY
jgi:hypothetical protein